jgi:hypothetical protein
VAEEEQGLKGFFFDASIVTSDVPLGAIKVAFPVQPTVLPIDDPRLWTGKEERGPQLAAQLW